MRFRSFALALAVTGCVQTVPFGPELGPCADAPGGSYTYGEAGIGTCLAGPTDLQFFELDGRTFLAVANADPYYSFTSGSVLLIDWASIDPSVPVQRLDQLDAIAVPTDRFLGQMALVTDRPDGVPLLLVPTRESPETAIQTHPDDLLVFDLSNPDAPAPWAGGSRVEVGQDPFHVAVSGGRAFVLNLTAGDISVVDAHATPLAPIPLRRAARLDQATWTDPDGSGSIAEIASFDVESASFVPDDRWELAWRDHAFRAWLPTADGLHRWTGGDDAVIVAPTGADVPSSFYPAPPTGPFAYTLRVEGTDVPALAFGSDGNLYTAFAQGGLTTWFPDDGVLLRGDPRGGWAARLDAPSRFILGDTEGIAFEARETPDGPGAIGVAVAFDGATFTRQPDPALAPPPGLSYEAPMVRPDAFTGGLRLWFTVDDGVERAIFHSTSGDAVAWSKPTPVSGLPDGAAHPVVSRLGSAYRAWFVAPRDGLWWLGTATSEDGLAWTGARLLRAIDGASADGAPPRPAVQPELIAGFTVTGADAGRIVLPSIYARDGATFDASAVAGFTLRVATGHALPLADLPATTAANGVVPGSVAVVDGRPVLYATTTGDDGRAHLAAFAADVTPPALLASDLLPPDTVPGGTVGDPVVFADGDGWAMLFGSVDDRGRAVVRRAASTDGLTFTLDDAPALAVVPDFAATTIVPGSVQPLDGGRLRLWFGGFDGGRWRIGSALSTDGGRTLTLEPGTDGRDYQIGAGLPGTIDDGGVSTPRWFRHDGADYLATSAFDGDRWTVGLLVADGPMTGDALPTWSRRADADGVPISWIPALGRSFAEAGTRSPVVVSDGEALQVWFAGGDTARSPTPRLGLARGTPGALFPALRTPTPGDTLTFRTRGGGRRPTAIRLAQIVDAFATDGLGATGMTLDPERGFLYIASRAASFFYVADVRDDSTRTWSDDNFLDLEAIVQLRGVGTGISLRDVAIAPGEGLLYASSRQPDAVVVVDGRRVTDEARKRAIDDAALDVLPMVAENQLETSVIDPFALELPSPASATGLAVRARDGRRHLFATHFADDSLTTFDLDAGPFGAPVAYAGDLGARPHLVRLSPDGRFAVVASYLGDVEENTVSATLSLIDADPASPTFGRVVTTLVNR